MTKTRVALVFGGRSGEHAISCATAAGVLGAIDRDRYEVVPIGITQQGTWVLAPDDAGALALDGSTLPQVDSGSQVLLPLGSAPNDLLVLDGAHVPRALGAVDVVLPLLHGPYGEDGTLQGLLELAGIPYVGSGVLASAAGMDKHVMKVLLAGAGLPVGPYAVISDRRWRSDRAGALDAVAALGSPVFVKPARAGSSLGVSRVALEDGEEALVAAIEHAREHDPKVVVEAGIAGREIEVAVLQGRDGAPPRTSLPGEIVVGGDRAFYDFEAKYIDTGDVQLLVPADLGEEVARAAQSLAAQAFEALDCEGLARVDLFLDGDRFVVNEVNTMPGFTEFSMFPRLWQNAGMAYSQLIDELLQLALERPTGLR